MSSNIRNNAPVGQSYASYPQQSDPQGAYPAGTTHGASAQPQGAATLQNLARRQPRADGSRIRTAPAVMQPNVSALFRQPRSVGEAHQLIGQLGEAAHHGHISEQQYRTQADSLMHTVNSWRMAQPQNPQLQQSSFGFIMARAEMDVSFGEPAHLVAHRYGLTDPGSLQRLQVAAHAAAQQTEDPSPFAFNI
ncbi:hypothetical protein [Burkholderia perseverans]|uniref:hypothetical protein n=1 Tax=Burkholderia perseverans TaxID=2615214 RepID=UPI001FEFB301|nr:hypothetical protein [Burkholderia perseverans]